MFLLQQIQVLFLLFLLIFFFLLSCFIQSESYILYERLTLGEGKKQTLMHGCNRLQIDFSANFSASPFSSLNHRRVL